MDAKSQSAKEDIPDINRSIFSRSFPDADTQERYENFRKQKYINDIATSSMLIVVLSTSYIYRDAYNIYTTVSLYFRVGMFIILSGFIIPWITTKIIPRHGDHSTLFVRSLDDIMVLSFSLGFGVILFARSSSPICPPIQSAKDLPYCNNEASFSMLPQDSVLIYLMSVVAMQAIFKGSRWAVIFSSWIIAAVAVISSICVNGLYYSLPILVAIPLQLVFMIEYDNQILQTFLANVNQDRLMRRSVAKENEKNLAEERAREIRFLIANVAHDLKTPLQAIGMGSDEIKQVITNASSGAFMSTNSSYASLASARLFPGARSSSKVLKRLEAEDILEVANHISSACAFMSMTINRAIDFTKASHDIKLVPAMETVHLEQTFNWPVAIVRSLQSRISISVEPIPFQICKFVITDKGWLTENLLCLFSNAVKYSQKGSAVARCYLVDSVDASKTPPISRIMSTLAGRKSGLSSRKNSSANLLAQVGQVGVAGNRSAAPSRTNSSNNLLAAAAGVTGGKRSAAPSRTGSSTNLLAAAAAEAAMATGRKSAAPSRTSSSNNLLLAAAVEASLTGKRPALPSRTSSSNNLVAALDTGRKSGAPSRTNSSNNLLAEGIMYVTNLPEARSSKSANPSRSGSPTRTRSTQNLTTYVGDRLTKSAAPSRAASPSKSVSERLTKSATSSRTVSPTSASRPSRTPSSNNLLSEVIEAPLNDEGDVQVRQGMPRRKMRSSNSLAKLKEAVESINSTEPPKPQWLCIEVEDTGVGISDELKAELFNPFRQAQRMTGGTGLGLYSMRKRVEALGGACGVRNRRDGTQGSCFWFTVPYRPDESTCFNDSFASFCNTPMTTSQWGSPNMTPYGVTPLPSRPFTPNEGSPVVEYRKKFRATASAGDIISRRDSFSGSERELDRINFNYSTSVDMATLAEAIQRATQRANSTGRDSVISHGSHGSGSSGGGRLSSPGHATFATGPPVVDGRSRVPLTGADSSGEGHGYHVGSGAASGTSSRGSWSPTLKATVPGLRSAMAKPGIIGRSGNSSASDRDRSGGRQSRVLSRQASTAVMISQLQQPHPHLSEKPSRTTISNTVTVTNYSSDSSCDDWAVGKPVVITQPLSGGEESSATEGSRIAAEIEAIKPRSSSPRVIRVLVVDDSLPILKMSSKSLERAGFKVDVADNGASAVDAFTVKRGELDVILMDLQMPVMDGLEAARRVRAMESAIAPGVEEKPSSSDEEAGRRGSTTAFKRVIIIGMSANSDDETRSEALKSGMDYFIAKPFDLRRFKEALALTSMSSSGTNEATSSTSTAT